MLMRAVPQHRIEISAILPTMFLSVSAGWATGTPPSRYSAPSTACPCAGTGGAALLAMFMRVSAAIYTKAADVGADLIGKVEQNIPSMTRATPRRSPTTLVTAPAWPRTRSSPTRSCWSPR